MERGETTAKAAVAMTARTRSAFQRRYRDRQALRSVTPVSPDEVATEFPGPVESAVRDEIGGLAAEARPGLAQLARRRRYWPRCWKNSTQHQRVIVAAI